jgi:hypothetical protein
MIQLQRLTVIPQTEEDIAEIAGAGLTWVRVPIGFWAIETFPGEPFLAKTSWKYVAVLNLRFSIDRSAKQLWYDRYILRLLQWCKKYGIRVNLALIVVPGSANGAYPLTSPLRLSTYPDWECSTSLILITVLVLGFNYGGKTDSLNFLRGAMGLANAQRTLYHIKTLAEFVSQPEWRTVVPMLSILNEPLAPLIGMDRLRSL